MTMRNPNRTTKRQRRHIRRYNRYAARVLGIAKAARWHRDGILLDEAKGYDNLVNDLKYGPVPDDLNDRVTAAYEAQRATLERKLGVGPGMLTATSSNSNNLATHAGYEVSDGPNPHITLKYPPHTSFVASVPYRNGARQADAMFAAWEAYRKGRELGDTVEVPATPEFAPIADIVGAAEVSTDYIAPVGGIEPEPLGPSACGHYEVFDTPMRVDATLHITENNLTELVDGLFIRELAEERAAAYVAWNGEPWHDPNEVAAVHAEAIENALNNDYEG